MRQMIYKYELPFTDESIIRLPLAAQVLNAQFQGSRLQLWALVRLPAAEEERRFYIMGTGQDFTGREGRYVSTVQDGIFVWHIFEGHPPSNS